MSIPPQVQELVERFDRNLEDYKRGKYNEAQVRREFIDPFFNNNSKTRVQKDYDKLD